MHYIWGWGKTVQGRLAPDLGNRLTPHAHYLKEGGIWKKYVMSLNLNYRRYYNGNHVLALLCSLLSLYEKNYDMYNDGEILHQNRCKC